MTEPETFEDNALLLLSILLARTDDTIAVTWDEVADARRRLAENTPQLVTYPADRLSAPDRIGVEIRYKPKEPTLASILADSFREEAVRLLPVPLPVRDLPRGGQ